MRNRLLLRGIITFVFILGLEWCQPEAARAQNQPNFVFFLVDDLRFNGCGAAGHNYINTPNIDRIAAEGIRFTNAFVTTPLCGPSRHCFLTGKYARTTGARSNGATIDWSAHTPFTKLLQNAGYQTAFIGKSHMGNLGVPITGFNYWVGFPSQGVYFGTVEDPIDLKISTDGTTYNTVLHTSGEYNTDLLTDYAENWLDGLDDAGPSPPFCLLLWYKAVHDPRTPATRHASLYSTDNFTMTPAMTNPVAAGKPSLIQASINSWLPKSLSEKQVGVDNIARKDARTLMAVDESVRDILNKLAGMGVLDDTVIVFTSDNGYFFRDFGLGDKRWQHDPSIRIPWFVRYPPIVASGRTSNEPILNIDLPPTFLDLAGITIPADMQGESFKSILEDNPGVWRTSFLTEYFQEAVWNHPTMDAVTMDIGGTNYKYIHYPWNPAEDELYDLAADPYEITNVIGNPAYGSQLATLQTEREQVVSNLTPTIPETVYIELGTFNHDYGVLMMGNGDGRTEPVDIGGREARKTLDPSQDHYIYFAARDEWAYRGNRSEVDITIDYYDTASGSLSLQYDSSDFGLPNTGRYKGGGSVAMTGTGTWKQHTFHVTDAYFGNRQNAGADFRISSGGGTIIYLDRVQVAGEAVQKPPKVANPSPSNGAIKVLRNAMLGWSAAEHATSYNIYLGQTSPGTFVVNQEETTFDPGWLDSRMTYYWRIDPINDFWTTTGDVWSFTTTVFGDFDGDDDVDQEDFGHFQACFSGTGDLYGAGCKDADMDSDEDVDLVDFNIFHSCMAGANQSPGC
ncbi:MAG: sulfatase-like hydrolase/transferase [Planctomycetota bacterium]|nr:MAG: sulfatase-like hydrolase/transferase [Planctomycetota bacterium]